MAINNLTAENAARIIRKARMVAAGYSDEWIAKHSVSVPDAYDLKVAKKLLPDFEALMLPGEPPR